MPQDNLVGLSTTIEAPVHLADCLNASNIIEADDDTGFIKESCHLYIVPLMISNIGYLQASNTASSDYFGSAVSPSADGNTLAVGAFEESSNATGIDGDQANDGASESGAVYVY